MRSLRLVAVLAFLAIPTVLQAQPFPEGWMIRADRPGSDLSEIFFVDMPPGWHVTTGPAVILYHPDMVAGGEFGAKMEVYLFDPGERREAFGMFIGGHELEGDGQRYLYFVIREGGEFLVKTRHGRDTSTLVDWTAHPAVRSFADLPEGEASMLNVLEVSAGAEHVAFFVNGQEVTRLPRADLEHLTLDGVVGMRVNHALNLHVSALTVSPEGR